MRTLWRISFLFLFLMLGLNGCGNLPSKSDHAKSRNSSNTKNAILSDLSGTDAQNSDTEKAAVGDPSVNEKNSNTKDQKEEDVLSAGALTESQLSQLGEPVAISEDQYPYDIGEDRQKTDIQKPEISVGDRLYMTQINDWFMNFQDYEGKTVSIEGIYMIFGGKYNFVGRNGPSCPYCVGGYVNFEFQSDADLSGLVSEQSWIRVTGILRQGKSVLSNGKEQPFYYIEALEVLPLEKAGVNPITD